MYKYTKSHNDFEMHFADTEVYVVSELAIERSRFSESEWRSVCSAVDAYNKLPTYKDRYLQVVIWALKKSEIFDELRISRNTFIIKALNHSTFRVSHDNNNVYFYDMHIWATTEKQSAFSSTLYHTSPNGNLKVLVPSMGGIISAHSVYSTPRIYCTNIPTTAGGWPLIKGKDAIKAIRDADRFIKSNDETTLKWITKTLAKWIYHARTDSIYEVNYRDCTLYNDPEFNFIKDKDNPLRVFYIKTLKPVPCKKIPKTDMISYQYLYDNASDTMKQFFDQNPNIKKMSEEGLGWRKDHIDNMKVLRKIKYNKKLLANEIFSEAMNRGRR